MSKPLDLIGHRYGKLVAVRRVSGGKRGKSLWFCECDCGAKTIVVGTNLVRGLTRSCGCLNKAVTSERFAKHKLSAHRLYKIWTDMKKRCTNKSHKSFNDYGGRGIKVCDEWAHYFQRFYEWSICNGYEDTLSIDRIDVNGDYCPENCRWADRITQANNCRTNHYLTHNGETKTIAEWARALGMSDSVIRQRLSKLGWSVEKTLSTPLLRNYKKRCTTYKKNDCYFLEDTE